MNQEHYAARAAAARNMARRAATPAVAAIHAELASRYEQLASRPDRNNEIILTGVQPA